MIDKQESPEPQNVTRRRFIKRSGGATVGTAIGLYALQAPAWAEENDDSELLYLVCTHAPDPQEIALLAEYSDFQKKQVPTGGGRAALERWMRNRLTFLSTPPQKGQNKLIPVGGEAKFTLKPKLWSFHQVRGWDDDTNSYSILHGEVLRTAKETQDIVGSREEGLVYRAPNVSDYLKDESGNSNPWGAGVPAAVTAIGGGVIINTATVTAAADWAGTDATAGYSFSISAGPVPFSFQVAGSPGSSGLHWPGGGSDAVSLEWSFQIMNQTQLNSFLEGLEEE